ncbi:MAG: hypothetical protein CVV64_18450 [Candidatus Wallbacteria bacterium HGW-Wallbacteria-1]|jgi:HEAT repeat protein|uniref:HEAT repeat domain-containing protein n=1 Tax=Candidatus Wallbacteria bacterium HGW-Wallbacteria-1 TaxID=2013854 RepID=A0A2N1PJL5_9BACT|nr:MAG: hypothetical protein CVV64_18450 [Candidatus Wallbacteria bacterium HGW-Wallbacteria-1]
MSQFPDLKSFLEKIIAKQKYEFRDNARKDAFRILAEGLETFDNMLSYLSAQKGAIELRAMICWFLGQSSNEKSMKALLDAFDQESDASIVWEIAKSICNLRCKEPFQFFRVRLLNSPLPLKRAASAFVLGQLNDAEASDFLIKVLDNKSEVDLVRSHAAEALGLIKDLNAFDSLMSALSDNSVSVRFWSTFALGELRDSRALPRLRAVAEEDSSSLDGWWSISEEALDAIKKIDLC